MATGIGALDRSPGRTDRPLPQAAHLAPESYKFAAALQQAQAGKAPILLKIYPHTGHVEGKLWDMTWDSFLFLVRALRIRVPASFFRRDDRRRH